MKIIDKLKENLSDYETCFRFIQHLKTIEIQSLMKDLDKEDFTPEEKNLIDKAIAELRFSFGDGVVWLDEERS